jgi:phosphatidylinositol alpha-1,6-mannosyltransferase
MESSPFPLLFSFDYPPNDGGISRLCGEIVTAWNRRGTGVHVLAQRMGARVGATPVPRVPEVRVAANRPWREFNAFQVLRRTGTGNLVVSGIWYPEGLLALLAGARPLVILAHGSELMPTRERWRRRIWRELLRYVCESADLIVANSEYTRRLVLRVAPRARVAAVPLGVDHLRFTPGNRSLAKKRFAISQELVISSVSRVHAYKGHDIVLQALASIPEPIRRQIVYIVAGVGPDLAALHTRASKLDVMEQVRFLGFVPEQDLPDLYRASDLFLLCTRETAHDQEVEGFGMAFLEAQACGTPVVGTRTGGIPDAIREGDGGWLIDQDDVDALGSILLKLADNPDEFREAGLMARRRVERECTWNHYMQQFRAVLATEGIHLG